MTNSYAFGKRKQLNYCTLFFTFITLFSLGLSIVGQVNVALGSISRPQVGEQENLQEEERLRPQVCSRSGTTDGNNTDTTTGTVGDENNNNTAFLYHNAEYGVEMLCPQNWVYVEEEENPITGEFAAYFMPLVDLIRSQEDHEALTVVSVSTRELPLANLDLHLFADLNIKDLISEGYETVSYDLNATLSGMPAFKVVFVEPENRTKQLQVWTFQDDRAYSLLYSNHESRFDQFLPIVQDMIISFSITNETSISVTPLTSNGNGNNATTQSPTPSLDPPSTITSPTTDTTNIINNNQSMNLEVAKEQYLAVWNQTGFSIPLSTYVELGSATGYGIYKERENSSIFRPGETMVLYLEPVAFGHQQILKEDNDSENNLLFLMNFTADIIIADAADYNELVTIEDLSVGSIISHRQNTELHLTLTLTQDQPFPVGDYIISYVVYDQVLEESFQVDKRITIASEDNTAATPTPNVQGVQKQQQEDEGLLYENAT
jgi:hypothetical protein